MFFSMIDVSDDLTCTLQVAAMTPSTGVSEKGSNILSDRRMKSGFSRYLRERETHTHTKKMNMRKMHTAKSIYLLRSNVETLML